LRESELRLETRTGSQSIIPEVVTSSMTSFVS